MSRGKLQPIGELLRELMARRGFARIQAGAQCEAAWRELVHIGSTTSHLPPPHRGGPSSTRPSSDPQSVLYWIDQLIASGFAPIGDRHRALYAYGDELRAQLEPKGAA